MSETYCATHEYETLEFPDAVGLPELAYITLSCRECDPQWFVRHRWERPEWLIKYWNENAEINRSLAASYGADRMAGSFRCIAGTYEDCAQSLTTHLERQARCEA